MNLSRSSKCSKANNFGIHLHLEMVLERKRVIGIAAFLALLSFGLDLKIQREVTKWSPHGHHVEKSKSRIIFNEKGY